MATIDSLANETLIQIMEMLKDPLLPDSMETLPRGRYDALRAAALVCSRWREPAQRALFDKVELAYAYPLRSERFLARPMPPRHRTRLLYAKERPWSETVAIAELCGGLRDVRVLGAIGGANLMDFTKPCFADSSLDYLRLKFYQMEDDVNLRDALSGVGPRLQTMVIDPGHLPDVFERCLDVFSILETVQFFSWNVHNFSHPLKAPDVENLRTILDAFPSPATLRHLSIGTNDFSSLKHITEHLVHPTLTLLTNLDLPSLSSSTTAEEASDVAAIAKACEDRGIQWSIGGVAQ
ncbi:hypothetical protein RQP46_009709 [Phenoliferia psychrophenolica]